ncbi:beta-ketoacyl-ACP synthase III [Lamprobacter modestohalophilus]|uniref:Beta-ketoacyl-[acyl-carrier-protein] synthase III n=1 Tax=Lamprobacter modestohalophilus TaxID=1064514 RepID=A0A9X0W7V4_9GAMM|nr:beta-ketoacyl-ACP synthase III [Lamprobacter modestohalophilus]MCF7976936.1 ketoacyl-ACP synthase III [Chromatiaceae bacterium]MBK1617853.1 3-oxoacyl-ACP synthase [Lamprobacter modestohalophilus]MCF7996874.1 ketoacyl-ACP synthase III [Chromatiaceae bacterium]MCF8005408.1 ketoacyl-ACP synthase III [Chromatiaceae bacterium]MCF8015672.1 ketoacyl-ACP synthase III [Chromatiaceae bacterium]
MSRFTQILGTGSALPAKVVTNQDLERQVDTSDTWIRERTGIRQRHIAADDETCVDLAERAAQAALAAAGVSAAELDLIVVATTTPDQTFPSSACLLQERLDSHGCPAFDIQAVCTGFIYALAVAEKFIRTGSAERALVVGAETLSRIIDWTDRGTSVLFGDGAGAVVIGAADEPGIISTHLHADGAYRELLQVPAGIGNGGNGSPYMQMKGNEVFRVAVTTLGAIVDETLAANNMTRADIDWLVPHQANLRIIKATARKLDLAMEQVVVTVGEHGNTSAASIPLAFDQAVRDGRIQRGQIVLMEAFGGGFTWGSALLRY